MAADATALLLRLEVLEAKLDAVLQALAVEAQHQWIDRRAACQLLSISERQLQHLIQQGAIGGDALRNVGTLQRPRYRFHRQKVLEQYLNRNSLVRRAITAADRETARASTPCAAG